jgi:thiamine biosynthesis lipoprotein
MNNPQQMSNRWKNAWYSLALLALVLAVWWWRQRALPEPVKIEGATMGTVYHVTYFDPEGRIFKREIDSVLRVVNQAINNYDSASDVSRFNRSAGTFRFSNPYFRSILNYAKEVAAASAGAFDPTVMPLVNAWGFGPGQTLQLDSARVDSLLQLVGFDKVSVSEDQISKTDARIQIDFGGIGQGFGADAIAGFLREKGITNMLVELGGEGIAAGKNLKSGQPWELGILDPASTHVNQFFKAYVKLEDRAFTTSGNYFNYREINGRKYSHTISPVTGYPVQHELLSASVFAKDATTADAWATACMVAGLEQAKSWMAARPDLDAFFIFSTPNGIETFATPGIKNHITLQP